MHRKGQIRHSQPSTPLQQISKGTGLDRRLFQRYGGDFIVSPELSSNGSDKPEKVRKQEKELRRTMLVHKQ